jgi:hypothetical protein
MDDHDNCDNVRLRRFLHRLNRHGYALQYAALDALDKVRSNHYVFEAAEVPVEVRGRVTHIDFVLRQSGYPVYVVAECKRANPAFCNWCFVKAPYVRRGLNGEYLLCEMYSRPDQGSTHCEGIGVQANLLNEVYHKGFAVKSENKGDPSAIDRGDDTIELAVSQAFRGVSGLAEFLRLNAGRSLDQRSQCVRLTNRTPAWRGLKSRGRRLGLRFGFSGGRGASRRGLLGGRGGV